MMMRKIIYHISILMLLVMGFAVPVSAQDATLTVEILDLPNIAAPLQVGEEITFRVRYSCGANIGGDCDALDIQIQLPDWFNNATAVLNNSAPYTNTTFDATGLLRIFDVDATAADGSRLDPGESETATITLRVLDDAYDLATLFPPGNDDVRTITSTVNSNANTNTPPPNQDIALEAPDFNWNITKTRILPAAPLEPALDQPVTYRVCLASGSTVDNYVLDDFVITDTFPAGATVVSPTAGGANPVIAIVGNQITWTYTAQSQSFRGGQVCNNVTLIYPSPGFGDPNNPNAAPPVTNTAGFQVNDNQGVCPAACVGTDNTTHGFDPESSTPSRNKSIAGNPVGLTGIGRWILDTGTSASNAPTSSLILFDEMPFQNGVDGNPNTLDDVLPLEITQIRPATWSDVFGTEIRAILQVSTTPTCETNRAGAIWTSLISESGDLIFDGTNADNANVNAPVTTIRCFRAVFEQSTDGGLTFNPGVPMNFQLNNNFELIFQVRGADATFVGQTFTNCMDVTYSIGAGAAQTTPDECEDVEIAGNTQNVSVDTNKTISPSNPEPEEAITITLEMRLTERASANLIDPIIADALPDNIWIDTGGDFWDIEYVNTGGGDVTITEADIRAGVGGAGFSVNNVTLTTPAETRQVVRFDLNGINIAPPGAGTKRVRIRIYGTLRPFTSNGTYTNNSYFGENGPGQLVCEDTATPGNPGTTPDVDNLFGQGTATPLCQTNRNYNVPRTARFAGQKWLRNENDPTNLIVAPGLMGACEDGQTVTSGQLSLPNYSRNPCVHVGDNGHTFTYRLTIQNNGNVDLFNYYLYDILPFEGDTGVRSDLVGPSRESAWRPVMQPNGLSFADSDRATGAPVSNALLNAGQFTLEYSDAQNPCRPEVGNVGGCTPVVWSTNPAADFAGGWNDVQSFRIRLNNGVAWEPGIRAEFVVQMLIPAVNFYGVGNIQNPVPGDIAWNLYAHNFYENPGENAADLLAAAQPPRVGIMVVERFSLGNRVWIDPNNSATIDAADGATPGRAGVTVNLYADANNDGIPDSATPVATDTTDAEGYYLFDNLPAGRYVVAIPNSNFAAGQPLQNFTSSTGVTGDNQTDNNDNGIDTPNATYGILSNSILLEANNEPTGEADLSNDNGDGPAGERRGSRAEPDDNSDLTIDFGFFQPMSLGNRVWWDMGSGGGVSDDGIQNGSEPGIAGVAVTLFADTNGNGTFDGGDTQVATDVTDANGYYLFDGLLGGDYFVRVDNTNFATGNVLEDFESSTPDNLANSNVDRNDDGQNDVAPATNGIVSSIVTLDPATEPAGETDLSGDAGDGPNSRGNNNEADNSSNLTVDFGFHVNPMSLGNRVWFDPNNSATIDAADGASPGISGVTVQLYRDQNNDGVAQSTEVVATDVTDANGYYLFDNLSPGFYFVGLSELDFRIGGPLVDYFSSTGNGIDDGTDSDDNGIDSANPQVGGILSTRIELREDSEPAGETDLSNNPADTAPGYRGALGQTDNNSDLTIDFGLYKPMSLGNRVWYDNNDNGLIDGPEVGVAGVDVNLYRDDNGNGIAEPGELLGTDTTDANGYYLFDGLLPGNYIVEIPSTNFDTPGDPLEGLLSSTPTFANDTDSNDNGINDPTPATNGIFSNVVTLSRDGQPTNEADFSNDPADGPNFIGNNGEADNNSDITVDFGFVGATSSIGNRVWFDPNNSATIDAADGATPGIANVTVSLYRDANNDGVPDGPALATDTTDARGYYLFDGLPIGNYIVGLDNSNFTAGRPLNGLASSTGVAGDNQTDSDDNGIDALDPVFGLITQTINLASNVEPAGEADLSNNPADGAPGYRGNNGETDDNSDLTIDFGLYRPMSIGNRVWFDPDDSGTINGTEGGITGVTVTLFRDDNGDNIPDPGEVIGTDTTDANGYYLFDNLSEGDYIVVVDDTNFQGGGVLQGINSSTGNNTTNGDSNDNGIDDPDPAANGGIRSNLITLTSNTSPIGETDLSGDPADGPNFRGTNGESDNNSNLTVDFGFVANQMSLGNRVWIDDGAGTPANARNGVRDAGEATPSGVRMSLYRDSNSDGVPDGAAIATDVTDANGYYLFDGLTPGNYLVGMDSVNFASGVLRGYTSTTTGPADTDDRDNGVDDPNPAINGIFSSTVVLQANNEPVGEPDLSGNPADGPGSIGTNGETDNNSNLTVDFGVYKPLSIGNRVWFDPNDSGTIDGSEVGIAGVTVTLYRDDNGDNIPDPGEVVGTDTTDGNGYYLFDDLIPADYIVVVDNTNFQGGGTLENFTSSTGDTNNTTDSNDNGIDDAAPATNGIRSSLVTLSEDGTPINETDTSGDTADGPNFRGTNGESDNNSDLTIDFGFTAGSMSLGNKVWRDDGAGGGTADDGIENGTEQPIPGVVVGLYSDANNDGQPDGGVLATDTTDANGYYLFDGLPPGRYVVRVEPSNFQSGGALVGLNSSTGADASNTDSNDNGIDAPSPAGTGILSNSVNLVPDNAPTGEADLGPDGNGANGENDQNSDQTIDFGFSPRYDWGDNPDDGTNGNYGTRDVNNGPRHLIISTLRLGGTVDDETDGQQSVNADGDGGDEDGVTIPTLVAGTTVNVELTVFNNTGRTARVVGWFDFNGDGDFDPNEAFTVTVPSSPTPQVIQMPVVVPIDADVTTNGNSYARFRLTTDPITVNDPLGLASDGEIEDYPITIDPPGLVITKTDGQNSIVVGQPTTYTITIGNSSFDVINRNFQDTMPVADPDGFDPATISWTCTATGGASCITGQPANTGATGNGLINEFIDIPRGGQIVYQLTATLRINYSQPTVTNTAQLASGETATDVNGVILDPPFGTKIGVVRNGNIIRWTMVWLNSGAIQTATVTDVIQANQTFNGNLICTAFGVSTTNTCSYDAPTRTVTWQGDIGTGNPNRVEIAFDVIVPGPGNYSNSASINVGGATANAANTVQIGGAGGGGNGDPTAGVSEVVDVAGLLPIITKNANPAFAAPGDTVDWTISVSNPNNQALPNVAFVDVIPDGLEILSANTSGGGLVLVNGQTVTFTIDSLAPGQTVVVTVRTRVLDVQSGEEAIIENVAVLQSPYDDCDCPASAQLIVVSELPDTGESPAWRKAFFSNLLTLLVMSSLFWLARRADMLRS